MKANSVATNPQSAALAMHAGIHLKNVPGLTGLDTRLPSFGTPLGVFSRALRLSIRRRLLDMVDDQNQHRTLLRFQLQPKLLLQRLAKGGTE